MMKLAHLNDEIAVYEIRQQMREYLSESISDYFALTLSKLRNGDSVDLDRLAEIIAGLKVLSKPEYRESLTRNEIGINPNSLQDLYSLLTGVGRNPEQSTRLATEVFTALKNIAPSYFKRTREELSILESGKRGEREQLIKKLADFSIKVNRLLYKTKERVHSNQYHPNKVDATPVFANIGGAPI